MAVVALRLIDVWPPSGRPGRPWLEDPDEDAFARSARSVCELYTEAVRQAAVQARHSELRIFCRHDGNRGDVLVTVHPEIHEGFEMAVALLPDGIARLTAAARAGLVLEVVHAAAARLGQERGWDEAALVAAREHALAAGLRYRWEGPAKTSPDRRHTAHPMYALCDDGYGRVVVQVRRREDGQVIAASAPAPALSTSAGFARSARTLRWRSRTVVELVPYGGPRNDERALVALDLGPGRLAELELSEHHDVPAAVTAVPRVVVRTPAETGPRIDVIGGGPTNDVPGAYLTTLDDLLNQLEQPAWQAWWSAGGVQVLEVRYHFDATAAGPAVRRRKGTVRADIRRPVSAFTAPEAAAGLARQDVEALLAEVRRRTGLGEHPPLS